MAIIMVWSLRPDWFTFDAIPAMVIENIPEGFSANGLMRIRESVRDFLSEIVRFKFAKRKSIGSTALPENDLLERARVIERALIQANRFDVIEQSSYVGHQKKPTEVVFAEEDPRYVRVGPWVVLAKGLRFPDSKASLLTRNPRLLHIESKSIIFRKYAATMMAAMLTQDLVGRLVEDYGIGSGILSLLALRRGAHRIVGIDTDLAALKDAEKTFQRAGYRVVRLSKKQWKTYHPDAGDQAILIHEDLKEYLDSKNAASRQQLLQGVPTLCLANLGTAFRRAYDAVIEHALRSETKSRIIFGGGDLGNVDNVPMYRAVEDLPIQLSRAGWKMTFGVLTDPENQKDSINGALVTIVASPPQGPAASAESRDQRILRAG